MAADHLQFLKDKFIADLQEAVAEHVELPLCLRFKEIQTVLEETNICASTPIEMKNPLYDLRYYLAECLLLAEKEAELKAQDNKTHLFPAHCSLKRLWFLHKTSKKLLRIKKNLLRMSVEAATQAPPPSAEFPFVVCYGSGVKDLKIHGLEPQAQKIEHLVLQIPDEEKGGIIKAIGITGISGVGKTALAQRVVENQQVKNKFWPIIWIRLSKNANWEEAARPLSDEELQALEAEKHSLLRDFKMGSSRNGLIVLDNVCRSVLGSDPRPILFRLLLSCPRRHELMKRFGDAMGHFVSWCLHEEARSVMIVTTILDDIARSMNVEEQHIIRLKPRLDAEPLWSIFMDVIQKKVFITPDHHQIVLGMKDAIIDMCDELPLASKTVAEIISFQIGIQQHWHWSDPTVKKRFYFELDLLDAIDYELVEKKVEALQGVDRAILYTENELCVEGKCDLPILIREMGQILATELLSVSWIIKPTKRDVTKYRRRS